MIEIAAGACTHTGHVRAVNEDGFLIADNVFAVADGMGGHSCGDVASARALAVLDAVSNNGAGSSEDFSDAVQRAHDEIRALSLEGGSDNQSMGTTLTALVLLGDGPEAKWLAINVGDSRIYRLVGSDLEQITHDHSLVQRLVDAGEITADEARVHPRRNLVTQAVGTGHGVSPDFWILDPINGERFLLCSDGVHGQLNDREIADIMSLPIDSEAAALRLVEAVLSGPAKDNATAVVVTTSGVAPGSDWSTAPHDAIDLPSSVKERSGLGDASAESAPLGTNQLLAVPAGLVVPSSHSADDATPISPADQPVDPADPADPAGPVVAIEVPQW